MTRTRPLALAGAVALLAALALPSALAAQPAAPDAAPFSAEEAVRRFAPLTTLDRGALATLDAQAYVDRLTALGGFAVTASTLALERDPHPRTTAVARDILKTHSTRRAIAADMLPGRSADGPVARDSPAMPADLRATARPVSFEEAYIDAMIDAHRAAVSLTSFYRRFGTEPAVREFARRVLPLLEASLYRAVAVRHEIVAELIAAREGEG